MLKTILCVYSDKGNKLTPREITSMKRYTFNTEAEVKVGDVINSPSYSTPITVVKVLDKSYKFYNSITGDLSDEFKSSSQWDIKTLIIRDPDAPDTVYGCFVEQEPTR